MVTVKARIKVFMTAMMEGPSIAEACRHLEKQFPLVVYGPNGIKIWEIKLESANYVGEATVEKREG